MSIKTYYKGRLPHIHPIGATFFITFRLADSLPQSTVEWLRNKIENAELSLDHQSFMRAFHSYDRELDMNPRGACLLRKKEIADLVRERLHEYDNRLYNLIAYCIMPNHVHMLIDTSIQLPADYDGVPPPDYKQIDQIMKLIKGGTASQSNRILRRKGIFWQRESYDRYIRDSMHLENVIQYILMNPVKAGLAKDVQDWEYSYYKYGEEG
ncbi:MAG: hypothetical protein KJP00_03135 [Bacteroidia bacterium]|nr:hypothetical protein [Bacteroidia bacterium]